MNNYCLIKDCLKNHCFFGNNGEKKKHLINCNLYHCKSSDDCSSYKIEYNDDGFVINWYCPKHRLTPLKIEKPRSIKEIQEKLKEMAHNAI